MNSYKCVIANKDLIIKKWDCEIKNIIIQNCGYSLKKNH